jgi:hypothetical protein
MLKRLSRAVTTTILIAALVIPPPGADACGPYFAEAAFVLRTQPDLPLGEFTDGKLGILQSSYYHEYLLVAYRYLNGAPLSAEERSIWLKHYGDGSSMFQSESRGENKNENWVDKWKGESAKVLNGKPAQELFDSGFGVQMVDQSDSNYLFFYNCLPDAFRTALHTLHARQEQFGTASPAVLRWTVEQNKVFANCGGWSQRNAEKTAVLPDAPEADDPPIIQKDRAYQIAAAHFYAREFKSARAGFDQIAGDKESPWRGVSPYLAARASLRMGTLTKSDSPDYRTGMADAEARLKKIVADSSETEWHGAAKRLLNYIALRLHPNERQAELAKSILQSANTQSFAQDLVDYVWLLDARAATVPTSGDDSVAGVRDEMSDWIETLRATSKESYDHAVKRWQTENSPAWLIAALQKATPKDEEVGKLIGAAGKVANSYPGKTTAEFHRLRLLAGQGKADEARTALDGVLGGSLGPLPVSARNQFLAVRMSLARSTEEFVKYTPRRPAATLYDGEGMMEAADQYPADQPDQQKKEEVGEYFDRDSASVLNENLTLKTMRGIADGNTLPENLRREVAMAAWTKAVVTEQSEAGADIAPVLSKLVPQLSQPLLAVADAKTVDDKKFAEAFLLLRFPGLRPYVLAGYPRSRPIGEMDSYHDNWWCAFAKEVKVPGRESRSARMPWSPRGVQGRDTRETPFTPQADFLPGDERARAAKDIEELSKLPAGQIWLGDRVFAYAQSNPDDERVPEALSLVVRATRLGCNDADTGQYSKRAFDLLHQKYPKSEWTKKTPYWYGQQ